MSPLAMDASLRRNGRMSTIIVCVCVYEGEVCCWLKRTPGSTFVVVVAAGERCGWNGQCGRWDVNDAKGK